MVNIAPLSTAQVADAVTGTVALSRLGNGEKLEVTQLGEPLEVGNGGVAFIISESYIRDVPQTKASMLVVQAAFAERALALLPDCVRVLIACPDAYVGLAQLSKIAADRDALADWRLPAMLGAQGVHSTAEVDSTARLGAGVVICEGARIGARTQILANAVIGPGVTVGSDCLIFPGVVLYPRTKVGSRVRLHANVVVGSDGFGYARGAKGSVKIWHLGRVIVQDDVEIGAGTTVDRGTLKDTIIESGAKIDNLCQIGHNGHVKAHAILCAQVGMAGNVTVGRGAILAGKVGIADKLEIGDGALVGPMTGVSKDVKAGEQVMGHFTAKPRREGWRLLVLFDKLPEIYDRLKKLEGQQK
ncbi:MAG: UDP-3-O-(3-hydroxymyristoyl)glucosamine N-acyltransferase [Deltaproteobacteria bacterium]|nr:UDP-3-O-(3-hydroxymyristoyl)glucosamine N-acyltransferase [Deltaproteobacteria bacterium]